MPLAMSYAKSFVENQADDFDHYSRAFIGPSQGFQINTRATGQSSILGFQSERVQIMDSEVVNILNQRTGNTITIPGYYGAAMKWLVN